MSDNYHFIGIGGIGMSGLASILLDQKFSVTGSDIALNAVVEDLIKRGAVVHKGHAAENIPSQAKVIFTSDVKEDNPEYQAALKLKLPLLHRSDLLAAMLQGHKALAVAGTHGKTTTTALLTTVLMEAGLEPSFAVGGILPAFQTNARCGKGELFPFEADESDRSFLKYHPYGAIVTNIDNDHLDHYSGSLSLLVDSFHTFMSQVESERHLFWCKDNAQLAKLDMPGQTYGFHSSSDWKVHAFRQEGFKLIFALEHNGHLYEEIEISLMGRHNVLNAAAVFGLAISLGVEEQMIRHAFRAFKGVRRRCEEKGNIQGILFLDDYAHHPTEIATTLQGIRKGIGPRRLVAIFQPHRYTRTRDCLGQFRDVFDDADELLVTDIYGAGESPIPGVSHAQVIQEIEQHSSKPCRYIPRSALSHYLCGLVRPYDVVVTLGAGDITKLCGETLSLIEKNIPKPLRIGLIEELPALAEKFIPQPSEALLFIPFGLTKEGNWVLGTECLEPPLGKRESLPHSVIKELEGCDAVLPLMNDQSGSLQGFLEMLKIPYIGSGPREIWLSQELELMRLLAMEKGIRTLASSQSLAGSLPIGAYFDFLTHQGEGNSILLHQRSTAHLFDQVNEEECLSDLLYNLGRELAERIFRLLGCAREVIVRLFLDHQEGFWFDRMLPVSSKHFLALMQEAPAERTSINGVENLLLHALQARNTRQ